MQGLLIYFYIIVPRSWGLRSVCSWTGEIGLKLHAMVEMVEFSTSSSRCVCVGLLLDACPNRICLVPLVIFMSQKQVRECNRFLTIYYTVCGLYCRRSNCVKCTVFSFSFKLCIFFGLWLTLKVPWQIWMMWFASKYVPTPSSSCQWLGY